MNFFRFKLDEKSTRPLPFFSLQNQPHMYKWKNNFGGVGQIDARWLTTRTLLGVGISFVAFMIGQGVGQRLGGPVPKTKNAEWRNAEAKKLLNENHGVIENHRIGQPAIYNEIPAKNWTGDEEPLVIAATPKSQ